MAEFVLAIDQGTTSTRAIIFDHSGTPVSTGQREHRQIFPQPGWVEHDPLEIWDNTREVVGTALSRASLTRHDIAAVGITNQRETTVVWEKSTGQAGVQRHRLAGHAHDQICDELAADGGPDRFREQTGLPLAPYFAGTKTGLDPATTSTASASGPRRASCCSAPWTAGCSGT